MNTYADDLRNVIDGFDYELCEECGADLDGHVIVPLLGHPFLRCIEVA